MLRLTPFRCISTAGTGRPTVIPIWNPDRKKRPAKPHHHLQFPQPRCQPHNPNPISHLPRLARTLELGLNAELKR